MPLAPSSMVVVRSPVWSWMRRTITHVALLEAVAEDQHRDRRREGEQRERHVCSASEHDEDRADLHEDQHEEDGAEADEAPDRR